MRSEWEAVARPTVGWGMWPGPAWPRTSRPEVLDLPDGGVFPESPAVGSGGPGLSSSQPLRRLLLPLSPSPGAVPPGAAPVLPGPCFLFISPAALALPSPSTLPVGDPALNPSWAHCPLHLRASWHHRGKGLGGRELCALCLCFQEAFRIVASGAGQGLL